MAYVDSLKLAIMLHVNERLYENKVISRAVYEQAKVEIVNAGQLH